MASNFLGGINRTGASGSYMYSAKAGMGQKPVNYVSFWDAARFANWLTNGQPTGPQGNGTTEDGMYRLGGLTHPVNGLVSRQLDFSLGQNGVAVASENEWYKAAYYQPVTAGGDIDGYWFYPTGSNRAPSRVEANFDPSSGTEPASLAAVGYSVASYYGTFDQGGNLSEWNDTNVGFSNRGLRGGSFLFDESSLQSSSSFNFSPTLETSNIGFRVSSLSPIPESSAYGAILACLALALALSQRRGRG
jgi:formylglycine-generating enzyme required for sulfatase activity